jgi:hypothetical protein
MACLEKVTKTDFPMPDSLFLVETQCGEEWFVRSIRLSDGKACTGDAEVVKRTDAARFLERFSI